MNIVLRPGALALVLVLSIGFGRPAVAESPSANAATLKAAFLVNFAKFAEWPASSLPDGTPLVVCVVDDPKVARALEEATGGRDVAGHPVVVREIELEGPGRACHLLYADGLDAKRSSRLVELLAGAPVLSVGASENFALQGGVANFFVEEGRMRFAVNLDAAQRARLRLSSRLLSLAKIVKDNSDVSQR